MAGRVICQTLQFQLRLTVYAPRLSPVLLSSSVSSTDHPAGVSKKIAPCIAGGGSAVESVEAAVRSLEDNTRFNAGVGSALNEEGVVEMDAIIMRGADRGLGAVTGARTTRHAVSLARAVMERSPHIMLAGAPADAFGARIGLEQVRREDRRCMRIRHLMSHRPDLHPQVSNVELVTAARQAELAGVLAERAAGASAPPLGGSVIPVPAAHTPFAPAGADEVDTGRHDTVGAVAVDAGGHTAAATSTGGMVGKWPGRVGDAPLVGCGGFADDLGGGAVSTTGTGELIARFMLARAVADEAAAAGRPAAPAAGGDVPGSVTDDDAAAGRAVAAALRRMAARGLDGPGVEGAGHGAILVTPAGGAGVGHSSARMSWAIVSGVVGGSAPDTVRAGVQMASDAGDDVKTLLPAGGAY